MAGLVILILAARNTGNPLALAAATVYGMTLVFCYVSSALYHGVSRPRLKRFFLLLDHAAIYLLIAGTYTPIALLLPIERSWIPVAVIWGLAVIGIIGKVTAYRSGALVRNHRLSTLLYVGMGWSGISYFGVDHWIRTERGWDAAAVVPDRQMTLNRPSNHSQLSVDVILPPAPIGPGLISPSAFQRPTK